MEKKPKKLILNQETLRNLTQEELSNAADHITTPPITPITCITHIPTGCA